ncbi:MAG TPA: LapA family protein [Hyphomicrobiales bacterium]|nr:LapA family protein [Hyphomicrobiales bacterium]
MRLLRILILFVLAITIVAFAVANRHFVNFVVDPLGGTASDLFVEAPLFVFLFGAMLIGFVIGGIAAWFGQARWRNAARTRAKEVTMLKKDVDRLTRHLRILERAPQFRNYSNQTEIEERPLIH